MPVVVLNVLAQYDVEVAWSGDQEVVEAFPAEGADEAFRDGVRTGCPDWGADDADAGADKDGVERGGELGIAVPDEEPEARASVVEVDEQVARPVGSARRRSGGR